MNQPYGDAWLELRPLAYKKHPYKWATIGKNIQHIEEATMEDVKAFFKKFYHPANAILCICGNVTLDETKRLVNKWFAEIPASLKPQRILPKEPEQKEYRVKTIERDVPNDVFMFAFKMPERKSFEYYVTDIMGSILGRSKSSMLYSKLKKEMNLVSDVATFDTGSFNEGLLIVEGELRNGVSFDELEVAFWRVIDDFIKNAITENEVLKMRNKNRTYIEFENLSLRQRAEKLCLFELLGDAEGVNEENELYKQITPKQVQQLAKKMLIKENCSLLKIKAKQA
ncbi:MAG TPA: insulinase family protein [Fluviicola sp.]|nr:insulinase family protein [Fluviicola sp.]